MHINELGLVVTGAELKEQGEALEHLGLLNELQVNGILNGGGLEGWEIESDEEIVIMEAGGEDGFIIVGKNDGVPAEDGNGAPMNAEGFYQFEPAQPR